jgi:hypothetical protein
LVGGEGEAQLLADEPVGEPSRPRELHGDLGDVAVGSFTVAVLERVRVPSPLGIGPSLAGEVPDTAPGSTVR